MPYPSISDNNPPWPCSVFLAGHEFWEPGVYVSPNFQTAREYARPHQLFNDGNYYRCVLKAWQCELVNFLRALKLHGRSSTIGPEIILKTRSSTTRIKFSRQESEEVVKRLGISVFFACSSRCHPRFTDTCWIIGVSRNPLVLLKGTPQQNEWGVMYARS